MFTVCTFLVLHLEFVHSVWPFFCLTSKRLPSFYYWESGVELVRIKPGESCPMVQRPVTATIVTVGQSPFPPCCTLTYPQRPFASLYVCMWAWQLLLLPGISRVQLYAVLIILIFTWQNVGYSIIKGFRNFKYAHKCLTVRSGRSLMLLVHRERAM